jgi:hypothetical protein
MIFLKSILSTAALFALAPVASAHIEKLEGPSSSRLCLSTILTTAAAATDVSAELLADVARRESSYNPRARAKASSAAGLFQFTEDTWFRVVRRYGKQHGLESEADAIMITPRGAVATTNAERILNLRYDPRLSAMMAGELTRENKFFMKVALGREPSNSELYVGHFMGPKAAVRLIQAAEKQEQVPASTMFPRAAKANAAVFHLNGKQLLPAEVLKRLSVSGQEDDLNQIMCETANN